MRAQFIAVLMVLFSSYSFGQDFIESMKVNQDNDKLVIEYELQKVDVTDGYFIVNLEMYYNGVLIKPSRQNVSGALSFNDQDKISIGGVRKKRVIWDILKESNIKDVDGDINVILRAKLYGKVLSGPEAAIYSLVVPGLGQYRVQENKKPFIVAAPLAYGGIATGLIFNNKSKTSKENSLTATSQADIEKFEDQANQEKLIGNVALGVGGLVWLADVISVAIKGSKNKSNYSKYSYSKKVKLRPSIKSGVQPGLATIGLSLNF